MSDVHVIPINDLRVHVETADCWCAPRLEYEGPGWLIVHHAADRREWTEGVLTRNPVFHTLDDTKDGPT